MARNLVFNQLGSGYNASALLEFLQNHWNASYFNLTNVSWCGDVPSTLRAYAETIQNTDSKQHVLDYADNYDKFPYFKLKDGINPCPMNSNLFMLFDSWTYSQDYIIVHIYGVDQNNKVGQIVEEANISVSPFLSENFWMDYRKELTCNDGGVS